MDDTNDRTDRSGRRRRVRRVLVALGAVVLLLAGATVYAYHRTVGRYDENVARVDGVIDHKASGRPAVPTDVEAQNWLVVGSDSRSKRGTSGSGAAGPLWKPGLQRTDTMMIVHLAGDGRQVTITSIPRDSWIHVPGHGKAKVNAAFSYGGPKLLVRTVEKLTRIRIDHYAAIDFAGFRAMTDAVGGVDVTVPRTVTDTSNGTVWKKGRHHLDGRAALSYVRQRHGLPGGDLDRIRRQQGFILALLERARSRDVLTDPRRLDALLDATTRAVTVDESVGAGDLRALLFRYRDVREDDLTFLTVPTRSSGMVAGQSVMFLDERKAARLFSALRDDRVARYLENGGERNRVDRVP